MGLITQKPYDYYANEDSHGSYQFISLRLLIDQFMISYVGQDKIIPKVKRPEVQFHAMRAMQEFSFDTFKSFKGQEIIVPASLQMVLPQDYVNYTKISWVDNSGVKHLLYPTKDSSNPTAPFQGVDGKVALTAVGTLTAGSVDIVLDKEYPQIRTGMFFKGDGVVGIATVYATSTTNGITTITKDGVSGSTDNVKHTGDRTLDFYYPSNYGMTLKDMVLNNESAILEGVSWTTNTNEQRTLVTASSSDASKVKPGWFASHDDFPFGTVVTDVQGNNIIIDKFVNAANTGTNVTFISNTPSSTTWDKYKSKYEMSQKTNYYEYDNYWTEGGERYGLDPQYHQSNGSFYIDDMSGKIHFSSDVIGKTIILDYISDGLGTDSEMQVHKLAEEAMYKHIAYAILSTSRGVPEYLVQRFKKERFAETRKAKLRLSNIKLEEITQILRGKSKQIKH